jgi:hypothetical protein
MRTLLPTEPLAPAQPITLWEGAQPIGTCEWQANAKVAVRANRPDRQAELQRLVQVEYRVQSKNARRQGIPFDASSFLFDAPRYLGASPIAATRPSLASQADIPAHLTLPAFASAMIPTTPRRKR